MRRSSLLIPVLALVIGCFAAGGVLHAQFMRGGPGAPREQDNVKSEDLVDVGIDEKFGEQIPLDLRFTDESGKRVALQEYFDGEHPVILTLNYSDCPKLCSVQLHALVKGLEGLDWQPGQQFRIVTVSIDPRETTKKAALAKRKYFRAYARPEAEDGWSFLTVDERLEAGKDPQSREGDLPGESQIRRLADALGFRYVLHAESGDYLHTAALFVLSPKGKICRYLYGVDYPSSVLRTALVESGDGKVGTLVDRLILYCFLDYDSASGSYAAVAVKIMRFGGLVFAVLFGGFLFLLWRGNRRKSERESEGNGSGTGDKEPVTA